MNLRDLQYLILVADHLSFRKAAQAAHVTQPTLSNQIRKLEQDLGVTLFERDNRNVAVTPQAEGIIAEARQMLRHAETIKDIAAGYHDPLSGTFRLGVIASLSPFFSPGLLSQLTQAAPRLSVHLHEGLTQDLEARLQARQLDAIITATEPVESSFVSLPLFREPFLIALPKTHRLAKAERVNVDDLKQDGILLLEEGHCLRDQVLPFCRARGLDDAPLGASSLMTLIHMVKHGLGVTFLPATAVTEMADGCRVKIMQGRPAYRDIRLVVRKNFPRLKAAELVAATCQSLYKSLSGRNSIKAGKA